jgi:hypothetical protein
VDTGSEVDRLVPGTEDLELTTGFVIEITRMKTRQFFRLLKVITHGAGPKMIESGLDFGADAGEFAKRLAALVALSIPDAEQETIAFLQSMCQPKGVVGGIYGKQPSAMSKQETENDARLWADFQREMFNPDPLDTFNLVERIVRREASDLQGLGKRMAALFELAAKTGQDQAGEAEAAPEGSSLQVPSPDSSTSSPTSTDGQTSTSLTSPSAVSGRQRRRPVSDAVPSSLSL